MKTKTAFLVLLLYILSGLFFISCNEEKKQPIKIECITQNASEITTNSVSLTGVAIVENSNGNSGQAYFFISPYYTDIEDLKVFGTRINAGNVSSEGGSFQATVSDLIEGTSYYYVASIVIEGNEAYGQVGAFMTLSKAVELTITGDATAISETTAILTGYVNLSEEMAGAQFGIIYSIDENPSSSNGRVLTTKDLDSNNGYSIKVNNLTEGTTYYYRAFVSVGSILRVGDVKSFRTRDYTVIVTTKEASNISEFHSTLHGMVSIDCIDEVSYSFGFFWGKDSSLEELVKKGKFVTASLDGNDYYSSLNDLEYNTNYYYVACVMLANNQYYGKVSHFNTIDFKIEVITDDASFISSVKSIINGRFAIESVDDLSFKEVGFYYSDKNISVEDLKSNGIKVLASLETERENTFSYSLTALNCNQVYYYISYAIVENKISFGKVKAFQTNILPTGAVHLGLSVLWATCNVGASTPGSFGDYYAWGEIAPGGHNNWSGYKWGSPSYFTKYNDRDKITTLELQDDIANVNLKGNWRMPTAKEFQELYANCDHVWGQYDGVNGYYFTSRINGNSIFLPYTQTGSGFVRTYWSSTVYTSNNSYASSLIMSADKLGADSYCERYKGLTIRAVSD